MSVPMLGLRVVRFWLKTTREPSANATTKLNQSFVRLMIKRLAAS